MILTHTTRAQSLIGENHLFQCGIFIFKIYMLKRKFAKIRKILIIVFFREIIS
jgi:hypothetical protein